MIRFDHHPSLGYGLEGMVRLAPMMAWGMALEVLPNRLLVPYMDGTRELSWKCLAHSHFGSAHLVFGSIRLG